MNGNPNIDTPFVNETVFRTIWAVLIAVLLACLADIRADDCIDHGIVAPVGMTTWGNSVIATGDGEGQRIVFVKLWTGNVASYLFIDAETGETSQVYPEAGGWGGYNVLMADGIVYDTMGDSLVAIDVSTREVRRLGSFGSGTSIGGYVRGGDGDDAVIYVGIYPSATLVSYRPATAEFINHGTLNDEAWPQYLRPLVIDEDSGWVYGSIGLEKGQVVGFDPVTGTKVAFIPQEARQACQPVLRVGTDGKVYARAEGWGWHRLNGETAVPVESVPPEVRAPERNRFPDGSRIIQSRIPDRKLFIQDADGQEVREVNFDYTSTGVPVYTLVAGPDGRIYGSTGIPLRVWSFDPDTNSLWNSGLGGYGGHINQFVRQGDKLYGAVYSGGQLIEYDPREPFDDARIDLSVNPRQVHHNAASRDLYGRPLAALAHPDGRHVLMGGEAARVVRGSGMLIYDKETGAGTMLDPSRLVPGHGIYSMVALSDGDVLVGTTTRPPTGGSQGPETNAVLYRFDLSTRSILESWTLEPGSPAIRDMVVSEDDLVYGLADPARFFVFDPYSADFIHEEDLSRYGNPAGYMAPRCMIEGPAGAIYVLFQRAVVRIDPDTFEHRVIVRPPERITAGIAIQDGRLYFACGSRLFSCRLPDLE